VEDRKVCKKRGEGKGVLKVNGVEGEGVRGKWKDRKGGGWRGVELGGRGGDGETFFG